MTTFAASIRSYEAWLEKELDGELVKKDLKEKHDKMTGPAFAFLRATYWRWAETILEIRPELGDAPPLLAIGDTHLENFGTWRDVEGRLIWGANDFDDAAPMPYALDLVRLATSALLAGEKDGCDAADIAKAILSGYRRGLVDPAPVVLERKHKWLRKLVRLPELERADFWKKIEELKRKAPPPRFLEALRGALPEPDLPVTITSRTAGTGSLGRPRFVGLAEWHGGPVVREAKALVSSAWSLRHDPNDRQLHAAGIAAGRFRAPDPHYAVVGRVVVRRLSPNSRKIEVEGSVSKLLSSDMLEIMGFEIANCHADRQECRDAVRRDLKKRRKGWLSNAASAAARSIVKEHAAYKARRRG